jgi:hypothetical protein
MGFQISSGWLAATPAFLLLPVPRSYDEILAGKQSLQPGRAKDGCGGGPAAQVISTRGSTRTSAIFQPGGPVLDIEFRVGRPHIAARTTIVYGTSTSRQYAFTWKLGKDKGTFALLAALKA